MKYSEELIKRFKVMNLFEEMNIQGKIKLDEMMLEGFNVAMESYQNILKSFIDNALVEHEIYGGVNKYEPILKLKYQEKVLKGVDIELLLELIFEENELLNREKMDKQKVYDFYILNKDSLKLIIEQVNNYEN